MPLDKLKINFLDNEEESGLAKLPISFEQPNPQPVSPDVPLTADQPGFVPTPADADPEKIKADALTNVGVGDLFTGDPLAIIEALVIPGALGLNLAKRLPINAAAGFVEGAGEKLSQGADLGEAGKEGLKRGAAFAAGGEALNLLGKGFVKGIDEIRNILGKASDDLQKVTDDLPVEVDRIPEQASEKVSPILDETDNAVRADGAEVPAGVPKLEKEIAGEEVTEELAEGVSKQAGALDPEIKKPKVRDTLSESLKITKTEADEIIEGKSIKMEPDKVNRLTGIRKKFVDDEKVEFTAKEVADIMKSDEIAEPILQKKNLIAKKKKLAKMKQRPDDKITLDEVEEIKKMEKGSDRVKAVQDMAREVPREVAASTAPFYKRVFRGGVRLFTDRSGDVQRELRQLGTSGKRAANFQRAIAGTNNKTESEFMDASNYIFADLTKKEREMLDDIIQSKSIISTEARNPGLFNPADLPGTDYAERLQQLSDDFPEIFPKLEERAGRYFAYMNAQLDEFRAESLIDETLYNRLKEPDILYSRRFFLQHLDPDVVVTQGNKTITTSDSGIDKLVGGSIQPLEGDAEKLLYESIARKNNRVFKNRANRELLETARTKPDNEVVQLVPPELEGTPAPKGFTKVTAYEEGKPVEMIMPNELGEQWTTADPVINNGAAKVLRTLTLADPVRLFATGINPLFGIANISRDIAQQFFATSERSSFLPLFLAQTAKDVGEVAGDVLKRKGIFKEYIEEGGGLLTLTRQGRGNKFNTDAQGVLKTETSAAAEAWNTVKNVLGAVGENSELTLRVAMYKRALKNGKDKAEAIDIARGYLDFNVGGSLTKLTDNYIPYLNAATQGGKALVKHSVENPVKFTAKVAQLGTAAAVTYEWNTLNNDRKLAYDTIPDFVHERNMVFMLPESFARMDDEGNKIYRYAKIPIDSPIAAVKNLIEGAVRVGHGDMPSEELIGKAGKIFDSLFPIGKGTEIPTLAVLRALGNYDTFLNRKIATEEGRVDINAEFDPIKTSETAKFAADMFNKLPIEVLPGAESFNLEGLKSPKRIQSAFSKAVPKGALPGAIATVTNETITRTSEEAMRRSVLRENDFIESQWKGISRRFLGETRPFSAVPWEQKQELQKEGGTANKLAKEEAMLLMNEIELGQRPPEDLDSFMETLGPGPKESVKRHISKVKKENVILETSVPPFWRSLVRMSPESKAKLVADRWHKSTPEEQEMLMEDMRKQGLFSGRQKRFKFKLKELIPGIETK